MSPYIRYLPTLWSYPLTKEPEVFPVFLSLLFLLYATPVLSIIQFRVRYDRWINEVKTHFSQA